jgi:hypothetical protein
MEGCVMGEPVADDELLRLAKKAWPKTWPDDPMLAPGEDELEVYCKRGEARVWHPWEEDSFGLRIVHPDADRLRRALHAALTILADEPAHSPTRCSGGAPAVDRARLYDGARKVWLDKLLKGIGAYERLSAVVDWVLDSNAGGER